MQIFSEVEELLILVPLIEDKELKAFKLKNFLLITKLD